MVRRDFTERESRQLVAPVGAVLFECGALGTLVLPNRIVRILEGEIWEGSSALGKDRIVGADFVAEDADGPTVGNDVMHGDEQNMFVFTKAQNAGTQERAGFEVEGKRGFRDGAFLFFGIAGRGREVTEVVQRDEDRTFGMNDLRGGAIGKGKGGTKDFVAADDFIDAALENGNVQRTGDAETNGDVPRGVAGS